jgi:hypothetical protein
MWYKAQLVGTSVRLIDSGRKIVSCHWEVLKSDRFPRETMFSIVMVDTTLLPQFREVSHALGADGLDFAINPTAYEGKEVEVQIGSRAGKIVHYRTLAAELNLYLISQDERGGYDTFCEAIVAARSEDEAKNIHPAGGAEWRKPWTDTSFWASSPDHVSVKLIGIAAPDVELGVILASFN